MTPQHIPADVLNFYAHRSGHEAWQYCPRRRYLAYHHLGTGVNIFPPLYFDVGTSVHFISLFVMSDGSEDAMKDTIKQALAWFHDQPIYAVMRPDERLEQETLIAGLLWAFFYRIWPIFSARFEVLMAEPPSVDTREFSIEVVDGAANAPNDPANASPRQYATIPANLHILSRPDAIVRDRLTHEITAINWKTINSITDERRQNITASLQVALESHYAERLYSKWIDEEFMPEIPSGIKGKALMQYLNEQQQYYRSLPREVTTTQIIYLVKGQRQLLLASGEEVNAEESDKWANEEKFWRQDSLLCYRWVDMAAGKGKGLPGVGRPSASWSYRYYNSGNKSYNNLSKDYGRQGVWEAEGMDIKKHVQMLNDGKLFPSTINVDDERNDANPLDRLILFENPIYRDVDMQTRLRTSFVNDEKDIAQRLIRVSESVAAGENLNDILDFEFPMRLISCRKPTRCEFDGRICNVPSEKREPLFTILPENGQWHTREPHHAAEREAFKS